jgi:hypothetical protein
MQQVADDIDPNAEGDIPFSPLVASIFTRMAADTESVTNALLTSYRSEVSDLRATLAAVRDGVDSLLRGPYMPTSAALLGVLWPSSDVVDQYREQGREG